LIQRKTNSEKSPKKQKKPSGKDTSGGGRTPKEINKRKIQSAANKKSIFTGKNGLDKKIVFITKNIQWGIPVTRGREGKKRKRSGKEGGEMEAWLGGECYNKKTRVRYHKKTTS